VRRRYPRVLDVRGELNRLGVDISALTKQTLPSLHSVLAERMLTVKNGSHGLPKANTVTGIVGDRVGEWSVNATYTYAFL
jgi:hypothetical protein